MHCSQCYLGLASDPGLDEHFAPPFFLLLDKGNTILFHLKSSVSSYLPSLSGVSVCLASCGNLCNRINNVREMLSKQLHWEKRDYPVLNKLI